MIQKILLAGIASFVLLPAFAQSVHRGGNSFTQHLQPATRMALAQQASRGAAKMTGGTAEELTARSATDAQGAVLDSSKFWYSGGRTSLLSNDDLGSYLAYYDAAAPLEPQLLYAPEKNWLEYDSSWYFNTSQAGQLLIDTRYYNDYAASGNVAERLEKFYSDVDGSLLLQTRYTRLYNAQDSLIAVLGDVDTSAGGTGNFLPNSRLYIGLDNVGKRVADTTIQYNSPDTTYTTYGYNATGLLDTIATYGFSPFYGMIIPHGKRAFAYDNNSRLITEIDIGWNAGNWEVYGKDTFGYAGSAVVYTYNANYYYSSGDTTLEYLVTATLTATGAYDTFYTSEDYGAGLSPAERVRCAYNSNDHLTHVYYESWNGTGYDMPYETANMYYQPQSPAAVAGLPATNTLTAYPNPATTTLTMPARGACTISIYNAAGQLLLRQSGTASGVLEVSIAQLPAGTYVAEVQAAQGVQRARFVKE